MTAVIAALGVAGSPAWFAAPTAWLLPVLAAAVTLLLLGLAGERGLWRRGQGAARAARIGAWTVAVAALALLVLRPQRQGASDRAQAVLWTEGAGAAVAEEGRVFALAPVAAPVGVEILRDARALWRRHPALARLTVRGHGLDAFDLQGFVGELKFEAPPLPVGLVRAQWSRTLTLGERLRVDGAVALGAGPAREIKLVLEGPAGVEDAAIVRAGEAPAPFALAALPRAVGPVLYAIRGLEADGSEVFRETLDAVVEAPRLPSVLVLDSAPRFETRFLKDWLAGEGGRVAVRATISKDRRRVESPGVPAHGVAGDSEPSAAHTGRGALDAAALQAVDAVVADPAALAALAPAERAALQQAIAGGCGLVVALPRGVVPAASALTPPPPVVQPIADLELLAARPSWPGAPAMPPLDLAARQLGPCALCAPLIADASGRTLAAVAPYGRGRVVWSLLHDSYRYVLEGNAPAHRALWSRLLSAASRPAASDSERWLPPGEPILVDRPLELVLTTAGPTPTAELLDGAPEPADALAPAVADLREGQSSASPPFGARSLALRQDTLEPTRWTATLWPRRTGWQTVRASSGATFAFAAAPSNAWPAWRAAVRQQATRERSLSAAASGPAPAPPRPWAPLPRWPFFALLLAGVGWLWIDERLRG